VAVGELLAASVAVAAFRGPMDTLVPYMVKNDLGGGRALVVP
jgi:hypothetical protein